MQVLANYRTFSFLICIFLVSSTYAHEAPILDYIKDKNPRLEVHKTENGIHEHAYCYDVPGAKQKGTGWYVEHWEADTLVRTTPLPVVEPPEPEKEEPKSPIVEPPVIVEPTSTVEAPQATSTQGNTQDRQQSVLETGDTQEASQGEVEASTPRHKAVEATLPKTTPPHIVLTQVMFHDWGGSARGLPQWFELHNRGGDGNLEGYRLTFFFHVGKLIIDLKDCHLATGETLIVARKRVGHFRGHLWGHSQGVAKVYIDPDIPNLKNRWALSDPDGNVIYERTLRWDLGWGQHVAFQNGKLGRRQAVEVIPSEAYTGQDPIYYGNYWDTGNPPGFHVDVIPRAPQLRTKRIGTWGHLKKRHK